MLDHSEAQKIFTDGLQTTFSNQNTRVETQVDGVSVTNIESWT
jgi:hypothetical protein